MSSTSLLLIWWFWFSFCVFTFASTCLVLFVDGFPSLFIYIYRVSLIQGHIKSDIRANVEKFHYVFVFLMSALSYNTRSRKVLGTLHTHTHLVGNNQTWFVYFKMISLKELGHLNLLQGWSSSLNGSLHLKLVDLRVKILLQGN
jgi:hypothetical protein